MLDSLRFRKALPLLGGAILLALAGCDGGAAAPSGAPDGDAADPAPALEAAGTPADPSDGDPAAPAEEPTEMPDLASPEAVLRSIHDGRARLDLPYLARCESLTATKPRLDRLDLARAHRNYTMKAVGPLWEKIEQAAEAGRMSIQTEGDRAAAVFDFDGAMGTHTISFAQIDGRWYIEVHE